MGHQGPLTTVDLLSVEQAKARLHALDNKFKWHHMDVSDLLDDESANQLTRNTSTKAVAHIVISLKEYVIFYHYYFF